MEDIKTLSLTEILQKTKIRQREETSKKIQDSMVYSMSWRSSLSNTVNWSVHQVSQMRKLAYKLVSRYDMRKGWETPSIDMDDIVSDSILLACQSNPSKSFGVKELAKSVGKNYYAYWTYRLRNTSLDHIKGYLPGDRVEFDLMEDVDLGYDPSLVNDPAHSIIANKTLEDVESLYCVSLDTEEKILDLLDQIEREGN